MAEMKTKVNDTSVSDFLNKIADPQIRQDCHTVVNIMKSATGAEPHMWGCAIIGFGEYTMTYPDGRSVPWMVIGFSPRKQNITLYTGSSFPEHDQLLAALGKHSTGKGCLYIKRLSDINIPTLQKLVNASVKHKLKSCIAAANSKPKSGSKSTSLAKSKSGSDKSSSRAKASARSKSKSRSKSPGK
jgi:hypothetical protein